MKISIYTAIQHLTIVFCLFHATRVFVIPFIAYVSGNIKFTDPAQTLRAVGYQPRGPCSLPRQTNECPVADRIHVILVSAQWENDPFTEVETIMSVKSIIASTHCRLFFHFLIVGESEERGITNMMQSLNAVPYDSVGPISPYLLRTDVEDVADVQNSGDSFSDTLNVDSSIAYSIYQIPVLWVKNQAEQIRINISHHSGVAGFAKLFIPQILWHINRAIYLDVDMLFAEDIGYLWKYFEEMDKDEDLFLFMGDNHAYGDGGRSLYPLCSCQLIMDLDRIRKGNVTKLVLEAFGDFNPEEIFGFRPGDQWVWTILCSDNKGRCKMLPKIWNISGCSSPKFSGTTARYHFENNTCWKVVHFNCVTVRASKSYNLGKSDWDDSVQYILNLPWSDLRKNQTQE